MPFQNVLNLIEEAENILLLTHKYPDGDAIASTLAFKLLLEEKGKRSICVSRDAVPKPFRFLPNSEIFKKDFFGGDYDLMIILDCGDAKRTGFLDRIREFSQKGKKIINIDHHPKNDLHRLAYLNITEPQASSTSEIIYNFAEFAHLPIRRDTATCILTGLHTDTGGFKHSNTTMRVLKIASEMVAKGARLAQINKNISNAKSVPALKLWGRVLDRLKHNLELGLVSSIITEEDIRECQAEKEDLAGVVNLINSIPDTRAAILFYELGNGQIKASIRTESNEIDVSRLAAIFGGGGLRKAGGFTIPGRFEFERGWRIIEDLRI